MKKKGKVFFHPIDGTGILTISWSVLPKGDAIEAIQGSGVGFFSENGNLLSVIFDEVQSDEDRQVLEFSDYRVEIRVEHGKVMYSVNCKSPVPARKKLKRSDSKIRKKAIRLKKN